MYINVLGKVVLNHNGCVYDYYQKNELTNCIYIRTMYINVLGKVVLNHNECVYDYYQNNELTTFIYILII